MKTFNQMLDYVMQFWDKRQQKFVYISEDENKPHTFLFIGSTGLGP